MRASVTLAKMATWAVWQATRKDRRDGLMVPPVLCYHRVLPERAGSRRQPEYSVTPKQFEAQMSLLAAEGFCSLSLEEYSEAARGLRELPDRAVLVTFDDGFADNYSVAWPVAEKFGVKLNLFICTGLLEAEAVEAFARDSPPAGMSRAAFPQLWEPLSWAQVGEMCAGGAGIGFHSHGHRNMGRMTSAEIAEDAATGIAVFKQRLGREPRFFAFPFGHTGSYPKTATDVLRDAGFEMFFTTELGRTPLGNADRLFSRIVIHTEDDLDSFRRKLFGGYDWVGRVRRFAYSARSSLLGQPSLHGTRPASTNGS